MQSNILIINGSRGGGDGNTAVLLDLVASFLLPHIHITRLDLAAGVDVSQASQMLQLCTGIVVGTGTYWDSWGSPLQKFLEEMTDTEGSELWLGKPTAVVVSMHAVGGKAVVSRLQGVLNTFGVMLPPMSGFVYSAANQLALETNSDSAFAEDLWRPADLQILAHNLLEACRGGTDWKSWPVDRETFDTRWIKL